MTAIRTFILGRHSHEHAKTHLSVALGYEACLKGHSVLFTSAMDIINTLSAAKSTGRLKQEIKKYAKPEWHFLKTEELVKFKVSSIMASLVRSCDRQPTGSHLQGGLL